VSANKVQKIINKPRRYDRRLKKISYEEIHSRYQNYDEIDGHTTCMGAGELHRKCWLEYMEGRNHLKDLGLEGRERPN
jgi:hypothetical protein